MFCSVRSEIAIARQCLELSTVEFSRIVKMSQASVSAWENFTRSIPRDAIIHYLSYISQKPGQRQQHQQQQRVAHFLSSFPFKEIETIGSAEISVYETANIVDEMIISVFSALGFCGFKFILACAFEVKHLIGSVAALAHPLLVSPLHLGRRGAKTLSLLNHETPKNYRHLNENLNSEEKGMFSWFLDAIINRITLRLKGHRFSPENLYSFTAVIFRAIEAYAPAFTENELTSQESYENITNRVGGVLESEFEIVDKGMIADLFHLCFTNFVFSEQSSDVIHEEPLRAGMPTLSLVGISGRVYHLGYAAKPYPQFRWETIDG
jgi:hypothetical protein